MRFGPCWPSRPRRSIPRPQRGERAVHVPPRRTMAGPLAILRPDLRAALEAGAELRHEVIGRAGACAQVSLYSHKAARGRTAWEELPRRSRDAQRPMRTRRHRRRDVPEHVIELRVLHAATRVRTDDGQHVSALAAEAHGDLERGPPRALATARVAVEQHARGSCAVNLPVGGPPLYRSPGAGAPLPHRATRHSRTARAAPD